jgi:hypothetical protein
MGEITCDDVLQYQDFLKLAPPFLLKRMAKKNSNLVKKFEPKVQSYISNLNDDHREKLNILLNMDIEDIQTLMGEAYAKTNKKQFKILADSKNKEFIQLNIDELKGMV